MDRDDALCLQAFSIVMGKLWGPVVFDKSGNLYGVTYNGGMGGLRQYLRLRHGLPANSAQHFRRKLDRAHSLFISGANDGAFPSGQLAVDGAGNGVRHHHGNGRREYQLQSINCGTVFELSPPAVSGGTWTETILHSFTWVAPMARCPMEIFCWVLKGSGMARLPSMEPTMPERFLN